MTKFVDLKLSEFLDALASRQPTPGGGTAAAIAGAMGTSLLMMVAALPKSRTDSEEEKVALTEALASLASLRDRFTALADADTDAFNQVMAAYRLPKATEEEKLARKDAIQMAMKAATSTPLDTLRAACETLRHAVTVAKFGNRNAVSDVGVGIGLLEAAADGAIANVEINLGSLQDEAFKTSATNDVKERQAQVADDCAAARHQLAS